MQYRVVWEIDLDAESFEDVTKDECRITRASRSEAQLAAMKERFAWINCCRRE